MNQLDQAPQLMTGEAGFAQKAAAATVAGLLALGGGYMLMRSDADPTADAPAEVNIDDVDQLAVYDGLDPETGEENRYHIAGQGSCSPFTNANAREAASGLIAPEDDLVDVQVDFLNQNPDFARNMGLTSESYVGYIFDALEVPRPSTADPAESMTAYFESEYYVTAPLAEPLTVLNTYCDNHGNVTDYRVVTLEADTYVGGVMIKEEAEDSYELANGNTVAKSADVLVAEVTLEDGTTAKMLAGNKAGVSTDDDFAAELGCLNFLSPVGPEAPGSSTTVTTTEDNVTTTTGDIVVTTTTTRGSSTTTIPGPSDKVETPRPTTPNESPDTTVKPVEGPATPDDGTPNPVGGTSTTLKPQPNPPTTTPPETTPSTQNPPSTQITAPQP
jgi:hypothetical protein